MFVPASALLSMVIRDGRSRGTMTMRSERGRDFTAPLLGKSLASSEGPRSSSVRGRLNARRHGPSPNRHSVAVESHIPEAGSAIP